MHYYKFNIADYRKDTSHLSTIEHGIYRQLIDWYYLDEQPITAETQVVIRRLRLGSDEVKFLENVLSDFFVLDKTGYRHKRIDVEIKDYHEQAEKNKNNGKLGGRPKKTQSVISGLPDESQNNPNHKPLTINHKPKKIATSVACPDSVSQQVWDDWMTVRKEKKAKTLTETGWNQFVKQVEKAGWSIEQAISHCCLKQWVGFEAAWVATKPNPADIVRLTVPSKNEPDPALEKIKADEKKATPMPDHIRKYIAEVVRKA